MSEMLLSGIPFDAYLEKYKIFKKTMQFMMEHLKNWYDDEPEDFQKEMRADYRTVAETYQFKRKIAAFEKNIWGDQARKDSLDSIAKAEVKDKKGRKAKRNRRASSATVSKKRSRSKSSGGGGSSAARVTVRRQRH